MMGLISFGIPPKGSFTTCIAHPLGNIAERLIANDTAGTACHGYCMGEIHHNEHGTTVDEKM